MSVLQRNVTRTVLNTTETTQKTNTPASNALSFVIGASDYFYVGYKLPFASRYFHFSVLNTNSVTLTIEYWNGTAWTAVEDVIDQTLAFSTSGFVSWVNQTDWQSYALAPITDVELYWIRFSVSGSLSSGTALQAVLNLFCDDAIVRAYYPELISDTRWLPPGRTDFLEQYVAAKDLTVLRLKQDGLIDEEAQVIDINEVAVATVHGFAWIVKNPISVNAEEKKEADDVYDNFVRELNKVKLGIDENKDGIIETTEENQGNYYLARG